MIPFNPLWLAPPLELLANYFPYNPIAHYEHAPAAHMGPFEVQPFQLFDFATGPPQPQPSLEKAQNGNPGPLDITPYSNAPSDWSRGMMPAFPNMGLYSKSNYTAGPTGPIQNVDWGLNFGPWQWDIGQYSQPYQYPATHNIPQSMQDEFGQLSPTAYGPNISLPQTPQPPPTYQPAGFPQDYMNYGQY